jgi:hypothetical protein
MQLGEGHVALVTGGASGLGAATASAIHATGASVVLVDLPDADGDATAEAIGARASFVAADVTDGDAVAAAVDHATGQGELRVAVNCAGVAWASRVVGREVADRAATQWGGAAVGEDRTEAPPPGARLLGVELPPVGRDAPHPVPDRRQPDDGAGVARRSSAWSRRALGGLSVHRGWRRSLQWSG